MAAELNQYQLQANVLRDHELADCGEELGKGDCPMCYAFALAKYVQ